MESANVESFLEIDQSTQDWSSYSPSGRDIQHDSASSSDKAELGRVLKKSTGSSHRIIARRKMKDALTTAAAYTASWEMLLVEDAILKICRSAYTIDLSSLTPQSRATFAYDINRLANNLRCIRKA